MCPRPRRSTVYVKTFSFNKKDTPENPRRRAQAHKRALDFERSNFRVKTFFQRGGNSKEPEKIEQAPKSCPQPRIPDFHVKDQDF